MSKRRKFSAEFKRGAVEQANQQGVSCAQVARELGIRDNLPTRWKRESECRGQVISDTPIGKIRQPIDRPRWVSDSRVWSAVA